MRLGVGAFGCCFLLCLHAGPRSALAAPALFPELFAGEQGCALIWITCIYLFKCPPQAVSGKGKAHASVASLMHIWLPYHWAGSKLQWARAYSRKWAETSLNQCIFFLLEQKTSLPCVLSHLGAARNANRVLKHVAVGNTALWSLDFIFLIKKNIYMYIWVAEWKDTFEM